MGGIDFGQTVVKNDRMSIALFAGYGYLAEKVNAYGCNQISAIPSSAFRHSVRGALPSRKTRSGNSRAWASWASSRYSIASSSAPEIAWLPYEQVSAHDTHWLRWAQRCSTFRVRSRRTAAAMGPDRDDLVVSGQRQNLVRHRRALLAPADPWQHGLRERHHRLLRRRGRSRSISPATRYGGFCARRLPVRPAVSAHCLFDRATIPRASRP